MQIKLYRNTYEFAPKLWLTLLTIALFCVLLSLGRWQLNRAAQKLHWQQVMAAQTAPPDWQAFKQSGFDAQRFNYADIQLHGHLLPNKTLLLDNRTYQGHVGYEVLSLFQPDGEQKALLVDHGWVPAPRSRAQLPDLPPLILPDTLVGRLKFMLKKPFTLANTETGPSSWPIRVQTLDPQTLHQATRFDFFPFILLLPADPHSGFVRDWHIGGISAARHKGYAVQWFALATTLLIIYFGLALKRKK